MHKFDKTVGTHNPSTENFVMVGKNFFWLSYYDISKPSNTHLQYLYSKATWLEIKQKKGPGKREKQIIQSITGNNEQTQTLELALLPGITRTLPVFSFLCISFILISFCVLRHLSAVLILFSSLSCTECLLHCDFYPKWNSKLKSILLSAKHLRNLPIFHVTYIFECSAKMCAHKCWFTQVFICKYFPYFYSLLLFNCNIYIPYNWAPLRQCTTKFDCIHQYNAIFSIPSGSVLKCYQSYQNVMKDLLCKNILYPNKSNKLFSFMFQCAE